MFGWLLQGLIVLLLRVVIAAVLLFVVSAALFSFPMPPAATPCSQEWIKAIQRNYVGAGDGHGPDPGSGEWFHGVESEMRIEPLGSIDRDANCQFVARELSSHYYARTRALGMLIRVY
jgi:hypothetical protein